MRQAHRVGVMIMIQQRLKRGAEFSVIAAGVLYECGSLGIGPFEGLPEEARELLLAAGGHGFAQFVPTGRVVTGLKSGRPMSEVGSDSQVAGASPRTSFMYCTPRLMSFSPRSRRKNSA